jgi:hypothetical protein
MYVCMYVCMYDVFCCFSDTLTYSWLQIICKQKLEAVTAVENATVTVFVDCEEQVCVCVRACVCERCACMPTVTVFVDCDEQVCLHVSVCVCVCVSTLRMYGCGYGVC